MRLFQHTIVVQRPREVVFEFFTDWSRGPLWRQYVTSMEREDAGPLRVGSRVRFVVDLLGEEMTYHMTVLALEPPALWRHHTNEAHFTGYIEYRFEETSGGTRVTFTCEAKPKTLLGWLALPQMVLARGKAYRDQLPRLKRVMEGTD